MLNISPLALTRSEFSMHKAQKWVKKINQTYFMSQKQGGSWLKYYDAEDYIAFV